MEIDGADGRTRTGTACATAPSRRRVYQFHHIGLKITALHLSYETLGKLCRPRSEVVAMVGRIQARAHRARPYYQMPVPELPAHRKALPVAQLRWALLVP